jgi:hypothetical protein
MARLVFQLALKAHHRTVMETALPRMPLAMENARAISAFVLAPASTKFFLVAVPIQIVLRVFRTKSVCAKRTLVHILARNRFQLVPLHALI